MLSIKSKQKIPTIKKSPLSIYEPIPILTSIGPGIMI